MKKIISLILALTLCLAFAAPVFAEKISEATQIVEDVVYKECYIKENVEVIIDCNVEITNLLAFSVNNVLKITANGSLVGKNIIFSTENGGQIKLAPHGLINLSFRLSAHADAFEQLLKSNGVNYSRSGDHIVAGCSHSEWEDSVCTSCGIHCPHGAYRDGACIICGATKCEAAGHNYVPTYCCLECGEPAPEGYVPDNGTASVLSQGYPEIVYAIGGLAVGFLVAMFVFKRKPAAANGANSGDEE